MAGMTDIISRLLDEAEKAQLKGNLVLAEVCRDASDKIGLLEHEKVAARREGIEAAAREVDCSCEARDAVLARLKARDLTRASWLCQHGDVCCALQAAEILDLLKDER